MEFKNRPNKLYNTEDGPIWHSRSVAVVGIIFIEKDGIIHTLVTKRADTMPDEPGKWCFPCGYLDWDETIEDATIREIYEETGVYIPDYKDNIFEGAYAFNISSTPIGKKQNVSITSCFLLDDLVDLPKFKLNSEVSEIRWEKPETIIGLDFAFGHLELCKKAVDYIMLKL